MNEAKQKFGNLAMNNHYLVHFSSLKSTIMRYLENRTGFDDIISKGRYNYVDYLRLIKFLDALILFK